MASILSRPQCVNNKLLCCILRLKPLTLVRPQQHHVNWMHCMPCQIDTVKYNSLCCNWFIEAKMKWPPFSRQHFQTHFSWMKMYEFWWKFPWSLFLRVHLTISQHGLRYWLGAGQATSQFFSQWWLVYWRIYASLGLNELNFKLWPGVL